MFKVILSYVLILNSIQFAHAGPGNTGGGDSASQELFSLIKAAPAIVAAKGSNLFPNLNLEELADFVNNTPIQVELDTDIKFYGKKKMSRCFAENGVYKVTLDPDMWSEMGKRSDSTIAKRAHAFHELLCLMGKEKNNDYSISSKLFGIESLTFVGIKAGKNQILPGNLFSKEVIFWTESDSNHKTFFYCSDRDNVSSCRIIGNKSYSKKELDQIQKKLMDEVASIKKTKGSWAAAAWVLVAVIVIGILGSPALALIPIAEALSGGMLIGGFFGAAITATVAESHGRESTASQELAALTGTSKDNNLADLAQLLHKRFLTIDQERAGSSSSLLISKP
ncbi:MAG: hypothetical protein HUU56_00040 [Bdellovibrionaceae bacterium]|nr:hypothetical protein [Pseudobdellovibrionaceae bacterium]